MTKGYTCTSFEKTPLGDNSYEITIRVEEKDIDKKVNALFMNQLASRAMKKVAQYLEN